MWECDRELLINNVTFEGKEEGCIGLFQSVQHGELSGSKEKARKLPSGHTGHLVAVQQLETNENSM